MTEQKKKPPKDEKHQIERFKEAARSAGVDESIDDLSKTFEKIQPQIKTAKS